MFSGSSGAQAANRLEAEAVRLRIAFVYAGGRESRVAEVRSSGGPTDFFYGAIELERKGHVVSVHDLNVRESDMAMGLCNRLVRPWLPPKTSIQDVLAARCLLRVLREVDVIVATASGCAFALAVWKKLEMLHPKLVGIHCGIVNCKHDRPRQKSAAALLKIMHAVLFADNEVSGMRKQFSIDSSFPAWFGVDEKFWSLPGEGSQRSGVLAVGNDSRRDYGTLIAAAALLPNVSFRIVTRREMPVDMPANVTLVQGDWKSDPLSDATLREFYQTAACVVVPLFESIQPSGQSVAMQAMMCGSPLVMTDTQGWWGGDVLRRGEEIMSVPPNDPVALAQAIVRAMQTSSISNSRSAMLAARWTSEGFAERLETICEMSLGNV